ncbi:MAG TPA: ribonuclease P protein component [Candidatus Krumholzibacteria bacterium]|nr:ribonuclease P protein component [Candidatus Krumholzibacteria bacterium]
MGPRESARSSRRRLRTLQHSWQFRRCYDAGRKLVTNHTIIFLFAPPETDGVRVGVVASKRVGGAVKRNRAKRLLREAARRNITNWPTGHWVVLVARATIVTRTADEIETDIACALGAGDSLEPGTAGD